MTRAIAAAAAAAAVTTTTCSATCSPVGPRPPRAR